MASLGEHIYQARLDFGAKRGRPLSQAELADILHVSQTTVGNWESDKKEPNLATIGGTTPEWLAFGIETHPLRLVPPNSPGAIPISGVANEGEKPTTSTET
jgi:transcriptional regulator with XRE-family HTH domain